jgi:hypothetical protein
VDEEERRENDAVHKDLFGAEDDACVGDEAQEPVSGGRMSLAETVSESTRRRSSESSNREFESFCSTEDMQYLSSAPIFE